MGGIKRSAGTSVKASSELRKMALAFAAGVSASALAFRIFCYTSTHSTGGTTTTATAAAASFLRPSTGSGTGSDCQISLGTYRGKEYAHELQTRASPRCIVESKFLKLQQHTVQFTPEDPIITDWLWIDYHDRINVLVEAKPNEFWVFRQTKYALENRLSWAIVGGIIEPGEEPASAAAREVSEELALTCDALQPLGRYRTDVNRGMGWTHTFLARQCTKIDLNEQHNTGTGNADEEVGRADTERQDIHRLSREQVKTALLNGEFLEIQWSATVALALLQYD